MISDGIRTEGDTREIVESKLLRAEGTIQKLKRIRDGNRTHSRYYELQGRA